MIHDEILKGRVVSSGSLLARIQTESVETLKGRIVPYGSLLARIQPDPIEILKGRVVSYGSLLAKIQTEGMLTGQLTKPIGYQMYSGEYEVTPKVTSQILETSQKVMNNDVTINKIPIFEVSNSSGGITVSIGKEV